MVENIIEIGISSAHYQGYIVRLSILHALFEEVEKKMVNGFPSLPVSLLQFLLHCL
jgi:hypothetical protein